jgi:hypothetical protein
MAFSVGTNPRLYNEVQRPARIRIGRVSGVGSWQNNSDEMTRKELGCTKKTS